MNLVPDMKSPGNVFVWLTFCNMEGLAFIPCLSCVSPTNSQEEDIKASQGYHFRHYPHVCDLSVSDRPRNITCWQGVGVAWRTIFPLALVLENRTISWLLGTLFFKWSYCNWPINKRLQLRGIDLCTKSDFC